MPRLIIFNNKDDKSIFDKEIKLDCDSVAHKKKKSILDILLDSQIPARHGCIGGLCGACISKILEGEEYILKEELHKSAFRNLGKKRLLSCIATIKENTPDEATIKIKTRMSLVSINQTDRDD